MGKITRVRTGCWTCKKRHRKCDEKKPVCDNCTNTHRECEGYAIRLSFDVDDDRNNIRKDREGNLIKSFIGKPKSKKREPSQQHVDQISFSNDIQGQSKEMGSAGLNDIPSVSRSDFKSQKLFNLSTKLSNENLEQLSSELFEDFEYLIGYPDQPNQHRSNFQNNPIQIAPKNLEDKPKFNDQVNQPINFLSKHGETLSESNKESDSSSISLTYEEENMMLKHFFKKLLPLLDAHPNSPWPDLALKYCDFDIARSCFISLACIHLYESKKGGNEYYNKGIAHINLTMDHLLKYINSKSNEIDTSQTQIVDSKAKQITSFAILVLINVHILFTVLENGKSQIVRCFFKVFASICQDPVFYNTVLMDNEKKRSLVVVLSWYDTVSAIVSPDCRLPYCSPNWYGSSTEIISTAEMMGCPGEIFRAMSRVCFLRNEIHVGTRKERFSILSDYESIKMELLNYREYVMFQLEENDYVLKLKGAQCWALATLVTLTKLVMPESYEKTVRKLVNEFIDTYGSMDPTSPVVTQMVWPVFAIGCACKSEKERSYLFRFMNTLYENAQMGTLYSLKEIVESIWKSDLSSEAYLAQWLEDGVDYLPL